MKFFAASTSLVLILCAHSAAAQSSDPPPPELKLPTLIWSASAAADWVTTYRFSTGYGDVLHEKNPLINKLDGHPVWMVTAGASIDAATWWAAHRFIGRRHPRVMQIALWGASAYRVYLAAHNIEMMREAHAMYFAGATTTGTAR